MRTLLMVAVLASTMVGPVWGQEMSVEDQIARAVLPLPEGLREGAEVFSYDAEWKRTVLRDGANSIRCQAPGSVTLQDTLLAQCFHRSWEPFMVRYAKLFDDALTQDEMVDIAAAEVRSGWLRGPEAGSAVYELFGDAEFSHANMAVSVPDATTESTGLAADANPYRPWLMFAGTPLAHVMIQGQ